MNFKSAKRFHEAFEVMVEVLVNVMDESKEIATDEDRFNLINLGEIICQVLVHLGIEQR